MRFNIQPVLENELLALRPLEAADLDALFEVASDCLIWEQHPAKERCQREGFERFFSEAMLSKGAFVVIEKKSNRIIGSSRFQPVKESENAVEIGWTFLAREFWGGIYNGSMKEMMMSYAFQFVDNVLFYINGSNFRSQKAVEKIGGARITAIDEKVLDPKSKDTVIYLIRKPGQ